jgi:tetratricopeptide (TPR) repeat protein
MCIEGDALFYQGGIFMKFSCWLLLSLLLAAASSQAQVSGSAARDFHQRGLERLQKGDVDAAIAFYDKAIAADPYFTWAYLNRGNAREKKGDLSGAIADFTWAIKLEPGNAFAYLNRA